MLYTLYILYSKLLDRFYVGYSGDDLMERIRKHNSNHRGFTGKVNDWELKYMEKFSDKTDVMKREREIKNWKSRKMITIMFSYSLH